MPKKLEVTHGSVAYLEEPIYIGSTKLTCPDLTVILLVPYLCNCKSLL
jgi:hypothetical protein